MVAWISASLDVAPDDVARVSAFWCAVTGAALPAHLAVRASAEEPAVRAHVHDAEPVPPVPEPASFPGVRRSRVYQVCLDIPAGRFDAEASTWATRLGGWLEVLRRRPEFVWLRLPGGPQPLGVLLQRLDRADGPSSAHLDLGTTDRDAETRRHVGLGARVVAEEEFWTVLADPAGLAYCIVDRDPVTGELT